MLEADANPLPSLPTATWLDETLMQHREQNKLVAIRFGRAADAHCRRADALLKEAAEPLLKASLLSVFTVDVDEVKEFSYMYELYDPFTIMLFWRSRPMLCDVGHGPVRKITEIADAADLASLLATACRVALSSEGNHHNSHATDVPVTVVARRRRDGRRGDERADDLPTWNEDVQRLASAANDWFQRKAAPVIDRSVEEASEKLLLARTAAETALETARGKARDKVLAWLSAPSPFGNAPGQRQKSVEDAPGETDATAAAPAAAAAAEDAPPAVQSVSE